MVPGHYYLMDVYVISTKGLHKGLNKMYRCHISLVARVSSKDLVDYKGYFTKILFQGTLRKGGANAFGPSSLLLSPSLLLS
jgi:hypothetical protein